MPNGFFFFGSLLPPIKASISWYKINCTSGWFSKTYKTETLRKKSSRSSKQHVQWDSEWFPWELANEHLPSLTPQAQRLENTVIIDLSEGGTAQPINGSLSPQGLWNSQGVVYVCGEEGGVLKWQCESDFCSTQIASLIDVLEIGLNGLTVYPRLALSKGAFFRCESPPEGGGK